jgi:nickel/cobalt transporter (NiCoT) family protein
MAAGLACATMEIPAKKQSGRPHRRKTTFILVGLVAANLAAWAAALWSFRGFPVLLGTSFLAYGFGLRHAIDADHIAAIDNVTRKLMQQGRSAKAVGLYFSLGHSTVVIAASAAIAAAIAASAGALRGEIDAFAAIGGPLGTGVSILFLLAIAAANSVVLATLVGQVRRVRRGNAVQEGVLAGIAAPRGLMGRVLSPLLRLAGASWHMYPIGLLFGLGFDTATEIGLLGISATEASQGLPIWSIMVFPALFTAGMSLVDTGDGLAMLAAYGWASAKPVRTLYYNLTLTSLSVLVALVVGGIEAAGLVGGNFAGPIWREIARLNDALGSVGFLVLTMFAATIAAFVIFDRGRRAAAAPQERD